MAACRMHDNDQLHIPVLLHEAVDHLVVATDGIYIDATFGRGSHSRAILDRLGPTGRLIAFDKDPEAIAYAHATIHDPRFHIIHSSFAQMRQHLNTLQLQGQIAGVLFDLGVSSPQLDNPERGFSFVREGKLDMRMDTSQGEDAAHWLASISEQELANVLYQYGEEKCSRRIARAIVAARQLQPITTTAQLSAIISSVMPRAKKPHDKHPATRSFQAIRIAVNGELTDLSTGLSEALAVLAPQGRLAVISFHSLEDRIVKQFIKTHEKGIEPPRGLPIKAYQFQAQLKTLGKAIKPSLAEVTTNPRARSAILRIAEKQS